LPMKFRVLLERAEDDMYLAKVPELPRCISQGKTREEVLKNIAEAMEAYLGSLKKHLSRVL